MKSSIAILLISIILLLMLNCTILSAQDNPRFDIVFGAGAEYFNPGWLPEVRDRWGATAIIFWVSWRDVQWTSNLDDFHWVNFDNTVGQIVDNNMKVYIRIPTCWDNPYWTYPKARVFSDDDYYMTHDRTKFFCEDCVNRYPLNFVSEHSRLYLLNYFTHVVEHISNATYKDQVQYIFPSTSPDGEMEYTGRIMVGYSSYEIIKFVQYLQNKYVDIISLNSRWNASFNDFSEINPCNYDWDHAAPYVYIYPSGRVDWLDFRLLQLKEYIDTCASIARINHINMGIELGSIYDNGIEFRGWYDPTTLAENVDFFKIADIIEYRPNFNFAADYMRSICNYWSFIKGKTIKFSTETNWPYIWGHSADLLSQDWSDQLMTYYYKGASTHFVFGWDRDTASLRKLEIPYKKWKDTLKYYSGKPIQNVSYSKAVHLSCEQGNFEGNRFTNVDSVHRIFDFLKSISPQDLYSNNSNNYDGQCDILTSKMIETSPTYVNNYSNLCLTKSSKYISDKAYLGLMQTNIRVPIGNATWYIDDQGLGKFEYTQGLSNEYKDDRSPIHLIWRSRPDLQAIWIDANLLYPGDTIWTDDFIYWASTEGAIEYPYWRIFIPVSDIYKYDENIWNVWNTRIDLQQIYPDGHHRAYVPNPINMISWAKDTGYLQSPFLVNYNYWPYIGGTGVSSRTNKVINECNNLPKKFTLLQNYPNPFNPTTKINYDLPKDIKVKIIVYDVLGREVIKLVDEFKKAGRYTVEFNGGNYASGVYFYRIEAGEFVLAKKMVLIK